MRLKEALKKYNFLKALKLPDKILLSQANQLEKILEGDSTIHVTPLAKAVDPISVLVGWDLIFEANKHKMNSTLLNLESDNKAKFGARSRSVKWSERMPGLKSSYSSQDPSHIPKFRMPSGEGNLSVATTKEAADKMKLGSNAGLPFLEKKGKVIDTLLENFDEYLDRYDPCTLFTRTQERWKTRNIWGYPFADTLWEMKFYIPILRYQKTKWYRAALISPECVEMRITEMIKKAMNSGRILYSIDFANFDASVKYQYIVKAFEYFASCFMPMYASLLESVGERVYSIPIVTPNAILRGKHGVPSGATFTNEVDSVVQLGIALTNSFIKEDECQIQGDDGAYIMNEEQVPEFDNSFTYAGHLPSKDKCHIAHNYVMYCQNLYHADYISDDGIIRGIYPTYRAINRILFMERFVTIKKLGIEGKDYFGIRCLSILENCRNHPLFEELVRYVLNLEKFSLEITDDGLKRYCEITHLNIDAAQNLKHQYGTDVTGIKKFKAYQVAQRIMAEPDFGKVEEV